MAKGNRGGKRAVGSNKTDTSYQGKQFAKASGTGNTVDMNLKSSLDRFIADNDICNRINN